MKNPRELGIWLLAVAAILMFTPYASAQNVVDASRAPGTTAYSEAPVLTAPAVVGPVNPFKVWAAAGYATGGVALRNRGAGNISISGVVGAVKVSYLYWTVISVGPPPPPATMLQIKRLYPVPASAAAILPGIVVGAGPTPCWGPANAIITVFRAKVPAAVATGNGSYQVTLQPGAAGLVNGADPYAGTVLPLWDGASLVMIGGGAGTVSLYDAGLAGVTFAPNPAPFNYVLNLPVPAPGVRALLDNIGADGQHVAVSRLAVNSISDETTTVNGFPIAGPGSYYNDSDWNGSSGWPVPELWDDTGHDISVPAPKGAAVLNIVINSALAPADCLTPVANVVEED
jgi:hypothetical protein